MSDKKFLNYKGVKVNAFGLPILTDSKRKQNTKSARTRESYHVAFTAAFKKDAPKNLIVMYDISERQKIERDWLRRQLVKFGYIMIQRSTWVGPSPLPKDFLAYIKHIGIGDKIKTLRLAKPYNTSISAIA